MTDTLIRQEGRTGHITLTRPQALNALTQGMVRAIDAALVAWADDPGVTLVVIDAVGDRAFCSGGDITDLYRAGRAGDYGFGQRFWREEYRMNARIAGYAKPVVTLMQGFCMGGGVGLGCHAGHRIVGESARIALPECGIGLVPDVGGSRLLARAPGRLGAYLGVTGARLGPGDAIHAGFADRFVPEADWPALTAALVAAGDATPLPDHPVPAAPLAGLRDEIDTLFAADDLARIADRLAASPSGFAAEARAALARVSPLAAATLLEMLRRLGPSPSMAEALSMEYRFTFRAQEHADFLEGIRAAVIDKDRTPRWLHAGAAVPVADVARMLAPLGADELELEGEA